MKLRNRKTGDIGKLSVYTDGHVSVDDITEPWSENTIKSYNSLVELNEEWEDYEEPKTFWAISWAGEPEEYDAKNTPEELKNMAKQIGNYFETKEEAERAVERLRAWKRLKDYDLHVEFANSPEYDDDGDRWYCSVDFSVRAGDDGDKLLDLLFGGEE